MATPSTVSTTVHNCSYWLRLMLGNDHYVKVALWHVLHNKNCDPTYQGLSEDASKLSKELKAHKIVLNRLKQKRVINKRQWQRLFPSDNKPCSKEFDVPILAVLIQYCTTLPPPKGGWEHPDPTDVTSKARHVLLACAFRNFLCHYSNPSTMLQPEFLIKWNEMEDIIKGLKYIVNTSDLKTGSLDPHCNTILNYLQSELADLFNQNKDLSNEIKKLNTKFIMLKEKGDTQAEKRQQEINDAVKLREKELLQNKFDYGMSLVQRLDYLKAKKFFQELDNYRMAIGKPDLYTIECKLQIGVQLQINGAYWDAMELFQEVLEQQKAVCGESHSVCGESHSVCGESHTSETLKTQQIIGECLIHQGKYSEAFCMLHETYEAQMKLFGVLHPDVLTTMHFIGVCLRKQRRYCDVNDKNHLQLNSQLLSETNYTGLTNYTNAMSIFIDVYNLRKELLGERHPDTLITKGNIGICLFRQKTNSGAMDIYRNVYEQQIQLFGETHPDTMVTRYRIGLCLVNQGKYKEALNYLNEVYSDNQKLFNKLHPTNIAIENGIALCLDEQENFFGAMVLYKKVQNMQKKTFGPKHPDTLKTQYHMILSYLNALSFFKVDFLNSKLEALNELKELYYNQRNILGEMHPCTLKTKLLVTQMELNLTFIDINAFLPICKKVHMDQMNILGEHHIETLCTKMKIGLCLYELGNVSRSQTVLAEVYQTLMELYGESSRYTLQSKNIINSLWWGTALYNIKSILSDSLGFCYLICLAVFMYKIVFLL